MMTATASHYETLGIGRDAPAEDVRAAYTRLVKAVHPDHGGSAALFRSVREAYEELSDPARRTAYDASLAAGTGAGAPCTGPPKTRRPARAVRRAPRARGHVRYPAMPQVPPTSTRALTEAKRGPQPAPPPRRPP